MQELLEGGEEEVIDGAEVLAALVQAELEEDQLPLLHVPGPAHDQGGFLQRPQGQRLSPGTPPGAPRPVLPALRHTDAVGAARGAPDPCGPKGDPSHTLLLREPKLWDQSQVQLVLGRQRCRSSLLKKNIINFHLFFVQIFSSSQVPINLVSNVICFMKL